MKKIILMYIFMFSYSFSYINLYPLVFDKRIDGIGNTQEFIVTNITNQNLKYKIEIEKTGEKRDMSNWLELYPKSLALKPGEEKIIKVYINAPKDKNIGEYFTTLNIKELATPNINKNNKKNLKIFTNLKLKLYGYIGDLPAKIELNNFSFNLNNLKVFGIIKNISNRRINIEFLVGSKNKKYLIAEKRLRKDEIFNLNNLNFLVNENELKKDNLEFLYIIEKETNRELKVLKI